MLAFPGLGEDAPSGLDGGGVFNDRFVQGVGRSRNPGPYLRLMGGVQRDLSVVHAVLRAGREPGVARPVGRALMIYRTVRQ